MSAPRIVDLFSGAGGMSAGFTEAGYDLVGAVDNWGPACKSISLNHPDAHVASGDIRKMDPEDFRAELSHAPDIVLGGPSCQGFSTSGGLSRNGRQVNDDRNSLFLEFVRFVVGLQPRWVVMENVPGLLLFNRGKVAQEVIKQFREIGYNVAPMILLAADYGVPQLRRRLVFIGNRTDEPVPFPAPTNGDANLWKDFALPFEHLSRLGNKQTDQASRPHVSFDDACSDLPAVKAGEAFRGDVYPRAARTAYQRLMRRGSDVLTLHSSFSPSDFERKAFEHLGQGENWTNLPDHLKTGRFAKIRRYDATTLLRRLRASRPAYTITTKFNDATTGAFTHPRQNRTLTLREAARLQSFPDRYHFTGSVHDIRKQIGNAVPPLMAQAIATSMLPSVTRSAANEAHRVGLTIDATVPVDRLIGLKPSLKVRGQPPRILA